MTLVLIWEEHSENAEALATALQAGPYRTVIVPSLEEALSTAGQGQVGLLVMGMDLAGLQRMCGDFPELPVLVVAPTEGSREAIEVVQAGAYDFLPQPFLSEDLLALASEATLNPEEQESVTLPPPETEADELVGMSRAMGKLYRDIAKLAATPVTVLIRGETGSGKELVARALWRHGHRAHHSLIVVNCAAIPENLLESELFGYEKGAFTGAQVARKGKFEQANGATLFLDEIGDMSLPLQAKMLRVLQEKRIERVGGRGEIAIDVRVIAATHQPLEKMVEDGTFREDLLYRLQGASISLPPLRDRLGDVELLSSHFLGKMSKELALRGKISQEALSFLARQSWPGNVRQLQNVLRRALLKRRDLVIGRDDLVELLAQKAPPEHSRQCLVEMAQQALNEAEQVKEGNVLRELIAELEEVTIQEALKRSGGNQSKAARWLGVTRLTLREKVKGMNQRR